MLLGKKSIFSVTRKPGKIPGYMIFINGKWKGSGSRRTISVRSPFNGKVIGLVPRASRKEAEQAVQAANRARDKLTSIHVSERVEMLRNAAIMLSRFKAEIIKVLAEEAGKTEEMAESELNAGVERLLAVSEETNELEGKVIPGGLAKGFENKEGLIFRKPVGVVLAISPFNYPLLSGISKAAPALLSGNTVIMKPASDTPISTILLGRIFQAAGFTDGMVNVITGSGSEIGDYLVKHKGVNMISFTGNTNTGKHIAAVCGMKKLHLELGGKAPAIILEDADMDLAVKETLSGSLKFSGQRCDAINRVLVLESIAEDFVGKVLEAVKEWSKNKSNICPLINEAAVQKVDSLVRDAKKKGAKLLYGGDKSGLYFEPTVLDNVKRSMRIAWEETFGPVVTIMRVRDVEEAIKLSRESDYALDACIFTKDYRKAMEIALRMDDGSVHVNGHPKHGTGIFPYGGNKASGLEREGIRHSIRNMTELQSIIINLEDFA